MWKELGEQQKQSKLAVRPQYVKNGDYASAGETGLAKGGQARLLVAL